MNPSSSTGITCWFTESLSTNNGLHVDMASVMRAVSTTELMLLSPIAILVDALMCVNSPHGDPCEYVQGNKSQVSGNSFLTVVVLNSAKYAPRWTD